MQAIMLPLIYLAPLSADITAIYWLFFCCKGYVSLLDAFAPCLLQGGDRHC